MKSRLSAVLGILLILACTMVFAFVDARRIGFIASLLRSDPDTVLFVGDVMLARDVEDRITALGAAHFFDNVHALHERATYVMVNFEAAIPEVHEPTPDLTFRFSVDPIFLPMLHNARVSHASLANNHADDFGAAARVHAATALRAAGIAPVGMPRGVGTSSLERLHLADADIAVVAVEDVLAPLDRDRAAELIATAHNDYDVVIVFVHWGDEYELTHSTRQEELAHVFVDAGADAIIGHHPHVVQDIGYVDDVPVFYSLGNYVFDQYWDEQVQSGLTLLMRIEEGDPIFELTPVRIDRAQPRVMNEDERRTFLESLARRSSPEAQSGILRGVLN